MQLLYNRRDGDWGSVGAGVVRLLQGAGAIVSRQQRGGWLAGRVGAVVVESRWSRRSRLWRRRSEGGSGNVEVASASGSGCSGCGLGELAASGGGCGELGGGDCSGDVVGGLAAG